MKKKLLLVTLPLMLLSSCGENKPIFSKQLVDKDTLSIYMELYNGKYYSVEKYTYYAPEDSLVKQYNFTTTFYVYKDHYLVSNKWKEGRVKKEQRFYYSSQYYWSITTGEITI